MIESAAPQETGGEPPPGFDRWYAKAQGFNYRDLRLTQGTAHPPIFAKIP